MFHKYFTVREANACLPEVKAAIARLQTLEREFESKHLLLDETIEEGDRFILEASLDFIDLEARMVVKHLESEGILVKSIAQGIVDFPVMIYGKPMLLCWHQGEEYVSYVHGLNEGYHGRKHLRELLENCEEDD
ncbi:hypothetical protein B0H94_103178 [Salsuginibacillus halophilus]|uniref:DUF2203 family protein n=1 Tax=Salsuginibacillus halophilus TaxID=517424 RepID=A0A2P8HWF9_9BACI|nr:DUF2203 domain-containing protein [Salsuginibacillus halophilus]PSL50566.1 hypothetical protein B0H94_103178 [Salsuginibacillus halophilus]